MKWQISQASLGKRKRANGFVLLALVAMLLLHPEPSGRKPEVIKGGREEKTSGGGERKRRCPASLCKKKNYP